MYLNNIKSKYVFIIFIILICLLNIFFYINLYNIDLNIILINLLLRIIPIILLSIIHSFGSNYNNVYSNRKLFIPFIIMFFSERGVLILIQKLNIELSNLNILIFQIVLLVILFFIYKYTFIFLDIKRLNFKLEYRFFILSLLIGCFIIMLTLFQTTFTTLNINKLCIKFIFLFFYPALYEEVIYRGFFMGWLKHFNINDCIINIIQSVFFGALHFSQYSSFGIFGFLGVTNQILTGFLLGQLYLYSGSLVPSIFIHALADL